MKTSVLNSKSVHVWLDLESGWVEAHWQSVIDISDWEAAHTILSQLALEHKLNKYLFDIRKGYLSPELETEVLDNRTSYLSLWEAGIRHYASIARDAAHIQHREPQIRELMPPQANVKFFLDEQAAREWLVSQV